MKRFMFIFLSFLLTLIPVWVDQGLCQSDVSIQISVYNFKDHPRGFKGDYFAIGLFSAFPLYSYPIIGVKKITAMNTDETIDPVIYEIPLSPWTNHNRLDWYLLTPFKGQYGVYKVTVQTEGSQQDFYTPDLPYGIVPLPVPKNLKVDFTSGNTTPTFSSDPVDSTIGVDYYEIRIYDKDYSRLIYRSQELPYPSVEFPIGRRGSTAEDLIPGEEYICRAQAIRDLGPGTSVHSFTYQTFKIPKK